MSYALAVASFTFFLAFTAGYPVLRLLRHLGLGKGIRTDGPESHQEKAGTPTLGGVLIWGTVFVSTALFNVVNNLSIAVTDHQS